MIVCESERLLVRRLELADAAFMLRQLNEPSWIANIADRGVRTEADAAVYIESRIFEQYRTLGYGTSLVMLKATGEPIGVSGFNRKDYLSAPDLGFALLERFQRQGFGIEVARAVTGHAVRVLAMTRMVAVTHPGNEHSGRVLKRVGFRLENGDFAAPGGERLKLYGLSVVR